MGAPAIKVPFPTFQDRAGQPLDNGNVYIGTAFTDAETNPIQVYWDDALTIPAAQPIKTSGGYLYRNGTVSNVFVNGDYSMTVRDSKDTLVYSAESIFNVVGQGIVQNLSGDGVDDTFAINFVPSLVFINGVYQFQNTYSIVGNDIVFSEAPPFNSNIELVS
jgi:hypothetical protein